MTTAHPTAGLTRRQTELLDQLEALFLAEGFAGFTLDDLAGRLHCSKSTLYALAGSKEQLAMRVVRHFFRKLDGSELKVVAERVFDPKAVYKK